MPRILEAALLADAAAVVGEGPAWDAERGVLSWVDMPAGTVHLSSPAGEEVATFHVGRPVGAALPAAGGGFLIADTVGFTTLSADGAASVLLSVLADTPHLRFNDGKCDPRGRAWAGTMAADMAAGAGTLYRLDPGPTATAVLGGLTVSNGLGWSPDAHTMWFADSANPHVSGFAYDIDEGSLGALRVLVRLQQTSGVPDGLCVDDEGCIWVALWGSGAVHRYTPDGQLDTVVHVPTRQVTSCAFGGPDMSTLFITTARSRLAPDILAREPTAGGLFVVNTGTTGPPATTWRGVEESG
jgi:sugar lactone lactonase YvrE